MQISPLIIGVLFFLSSPSLVGGEIITSADQLEARGVNFTWSDVKTKTVKILLEYQEPDGKWRRASLGSGFVISPDGLFLTAYHVMKFCLDKVRANHGLSVNLDCSTAQKPRYKALAGEREFDIQIISHLSETDSTHGKEMHTMKSLSSATSSSAGSKAARRLSSIIGNCVTSTKPPSISAKHVPIFS